MWKNIQHHTSIWWCRPPSFSFFFLFFLAFWRAREFSLFQLRLPPKNRDELFPSSFAPNRAIAHYAGLSGVAWKSSPLFLSLSSSPQTPRTCQKHPLLCSHGGSRASSIYQSNETMWEEEWRERELHKEMKNHHFIVAPAGGSAPWWWCLWCCSERCYFFLCWMCRNGTSFSCTVFFSVLPSTSPSESWQLREIFDSFLVCSHFSSHLMFSFLIKSLTIWRTRVHVRSAIKAALKSHGMSSITKIVVMTQSVAVEGPSVRKFEFFVLCLRTKI